MTPTQPSLPGFGPPRPAVRRPAPRRRPSDPALLAARADADERFADWRDAFAAFVRALPDERRAELRRRLRTPPVRN